MNGDLDSYIPEALSLSAQEVWEDGIANLRAFDRYVRSGDLGADEFVEQLMSKDPLVAGDGESVEAVLERMLIYFEALQEKIVREAQRREERQIEQVKERIIDDISLQCVRDAERVIPGITIGRFIQKMQAIPTREIDIAMSAENASVFSSDIVEHMVDMTALFVASVLGRKHKWEYQKIDEFSSKLETLWKNPPKVFE